MTTKKENAKCLFLFANENKEEWVNILTYKTKKGLLSALEKLGLNDAKIKECETKYSARITKYEETDIAENIQMFFDDGDWNKFVKLLLENGVDEVLALVADLNPWSVKELEQYVKNYEFVGEYEYFRDYVKEIIEYNTDEVKDEINRDDFEDEYDYEQALEDRAIEKTVNDIFFSDSREKPVFYIVKNNDSYLIFNSNN